MTLIPDPELRLVKARYNKAGILRFMGAWDEAVTVFEMGLSEAEKIGDTGLTACG